MEPLRNGKYFGSRVSTSSGLSIRPKTVSRQRGSPSGAPPLRQSSSSNRVARQGPLPSSSQYEARRQDVPQSGSSLRKDEVERIVKRVAAHYLERMTALMHRNKKLEERILALEACARPSNEDRGNTLIPPLLVQEDGDFPETSEITCLRSALLAEKRQRLLVEEQTQRLTEQHTALIRTLEQRLYKQEHQIRDILSASSAKSSLCGRSSPRKVEHQASRTGATPSTQAERADEMLTELSARSSPRATDVNAELESGHISPLRRPDQLRTASIAEEIDDISAFLSQLTEELGSMA